MKHKKSHSSTCTEVACIGYLDTRLVLDYYFFDLDSARRTGYD